MDVDLLILCVHVCDHVSTGGEMCKLCFLLVPEEVQDISMCVGMGVYGHKRRELHSQSVFKCLQFTVDVFPPWILKR